MPYSPQGQLTGIKRTICGNKPKFNLEPSKINLPINTYGLLKLFSVYIFLCGLALPTESILLSFNTN